MQLPRTTLATMLADLIAATAMLDGCKLGLITNPDPLTPNDTFADLDFATYDGYANSAAVTWGTPHVDAENRGVVQVTPKEFKPTGATTSSTVTQVVLLNGAADTLLASYPLPDPITFADTDDVHLIGFPFTLGQPEGDPENVTP